jgi:hypothetical protein
MISVVIFLPGSIANAMNDSEAVTIQLHLELGPDVDGTFYDLLSQQQQKPILSNCIEKLKFGL